MVDMLEMDLANSTVVNVMLIVPVPQKSSHVIFIGIARMR